MMLVVANFADEDVTCKVVIPSHAFDFLGIPHKAVEAEDMLGGGRMTADFKNDDFVLVNVSGHDCRIFKFNLSMDTDIVFNEHNKEEFPPAHTAEHLLNQTMIRMFG